MCMNKCMHFKGLIEFLQELEFLSNRPRVQQHPPLPLMSMIKSTH